MSLIDGLYLLRLINDLNRFERLLRKAKSEASQGLAIVAIGAERLDQCGQMEPLARVLEFSCKEVTAACIVDATIVSWIDLHSGEVIVEGDIVGLISTLSIACLMRSTLNAVALHEPELSRLEDIQVLTLLL